MQCPRYLGSSCTAVRVGSLLRAANVPPANDRLVALRARVLGADPHAIRVAHAPLVLALALRRPGAIIRRRSRRRRRHRRRNVDEVPLLELRDAVGAARLALDVLGTTEYLHRGHADLVAAKRRRESDCLVTVLVYEEVRVTVIFFAFIKAEVVARRG